MILPPSLNNASVIAPATLDELTADEATFRTWLQSFLDDGGIVDDVWEKDLKDYSAPSAASIIKNIPRLIVRREDV